MLECVKWPTEDERKKKKKNQIKIENTVEKGALKKKNLILYSP